MRCADLDESGDEAPTSNKSASSPSSTVNPAAERTPSQLPEDMKLQVDVGMWWIRIDCADVDNGSAQRQPWNVAGLSWKVANACRCRATYHNSFGYGKSGQARTILNGHALNV